jgi:plasmid stability protein
VAFQKANDTNAIIDDDIAQTNELPATMISITIRNLDPTIKARLRVRAAEHGHSADAEARRILQTALKGTPRQTERDLYERICARFAPLGGVELELPIREVTRDPPRFE